MRLCHDVSAEPTTTTTTSTTTTTTTELYCGGTYTITDCEDHFSNGVDCLCSNCEDGLVQSSDYKSCVATTTTTTTTTVTTGTRNERPLRYATARHDKLTFTMKEVPQADPQLL